MGFILEKTSGKGKQTIKVTPDSKNPNRVDVNKNLQIQVNGVTKAVVKLIQRARTAVFKALCSSDSTSIKGQGEEIKISYWATEDNEIISDGVTITVLNTTTASYSEISSGTNTDGTKYKVFKIEENSGDSSKLFQVQASYQYDGGEVKSKVLSLTQNIFSFEIVCTTSTALIPHTGGNAKITYYVKSGSDIITDGVELEILPATSDEPQPTFSKSEGTNPLTGNYAEFIIEANSINKNKYIKARAKWAKYIDRYSKEVVIRQLGQDATVLPDFDFFCFNYEWAENAGMSIDSMTIVEGTGIMIDGKLLDDYTVGYSLYYDNKELQKYIQWAGYNPQSGAEGEYHIQSGDEGAMINWKAICERDFITEGIHTIYAKIYGNWYTEKGTGLVTINISTYKGTGMIHEGFTFVPDDNTVLVSKQKESVTCYAFGAGNTSPSEEGLTVKDCYSLLATVEYDVASKSALLFINPNADSSGRDQSVGWTNNP